MSVPVTLDKRRDLHFDLRAIQDLERALNGRPIGAIIQDLAQLGITSITLALWAGLKHEDKALTPALVTRLLEAYLAGRGRMKPLADALSEALDQTGIFSTGAEDDLAEAGVEEGNAPGRAVLPNG